MYAPATAVQSGSNRDSVSRDQLLHARRRRRIKSMNSAPVDVQTSPVASVTRSASDVIYSSTEDQRGLLTAVPRQIKANHRTRSLSLNAPSSVATNLFASSMSMLSDVSTSTSSTESSTTSTGSSSQSSELASVLQEANESELEDSLTEKVKLATEGTLLEKHELSKQVEYERFGLSHCKSEEESPPKLLSRLNECPNKSHPIPLLSRKDKKRSTRSYSLPPKIPPSEQTQVVQLESESGTTTSQSVGTIDLNAPIHSLPTSHTLPKGFTLRSEVTTTHMTVWSTDTDSKLNEPPITPRKRKEKSTQSTGDWKLDVEEDEIRNLPIDTSDIIEHKRCLAPDPISMLVGDYPLDRTAKTLKFSSTISTSTMIIKPSTNLSTQAVSASCSHSSLTTLPNVSKTFGSPPQASPLRFLSFSRLPPAGLPTIPGISLIPMLQLPDNCSGFGLNSPRTPPDRSRYNVNIISPRSAFSPHTPHSSPR